MPTNPNDTPASGGMVSADMAASIEEGRRIAKLLADRAALLAALKDLCVASARVRDECHYTSNSSCDTAMLNLQDYEEMARAAIKQAESRDGLSSEAEETKQHDAPP